MAFFESDGCAFHEVPQQSDFGKDAYFDLGEPALAPINRTSDDAELPGSSPARVAFTSALRTWSLSKRRFLRI